MWHILKYMYACISSTFILFVFCILEQMYLKQMENNLKQKIENNLERGFFFWEE